MTSIQAAHRCARHMQETDLSRMTFAMLSEILDALNAALQVAYTFLPQKARETTVSEVLAAPAVVDISIVRTNDHYALGTPFTAAQRGCTVRLTNDPHDNEVVAPNAFLDAFLGNALTGHATVYGDCIPIFAVIQEVTSKVRLYENGQCVTELDRDQHVRRRHGQRECGTPRFYTLEAVGSSQNADPEYFLRVYPMPTRALRVRFECTLAPLRLTLPQLARDAVPLPVPDDLCESALIPLAESHLLKSRFWANPGGAKAVLDQADRAMQIIARQPQDAALPESCVFTPRGF